MADASKQYSDDELVALLAKSGDEFQKSQARVAFEMLFNRHASLVLGYCTRILKDRSRAEDVAQEVWMKVIRYAPQYTAQGHIRAWLLSIARTTSLNVIRANPAWDREYNEITFDAADHSTDHGPLDRPALDRLVQQSTHRAVRDAIHELPELQRTALSLRWIEELSYDEIAEAMQLEVANVKTLLHRAKAAVELALQQRDDVPKITNHLQGQGRKP